MTKDQWLELKTIYLNLDRASGNELVYKQRQRLGVLLLETMPEGIQK